MSKIDWCILAVQLEDVDLAGWYVGTDHDESAASQRLLQALRSEQ
jgi:hypothetical protein